VLGWTGITAVLFGVGELVVHSHAVTTFDRHVTHWVVGRRTPPLDATMKVVTWFGSWVAIAGVGVVALVLTATRRLAAAAPVLLAVAWAGESGAVNLVKHAVGRPRPPKALWLVTAHGASFPSGHAANATLTGVAAALVVFLLSERRAFRVAAFTVACLVIVAVAFSRVELGVHWTTDVVTGCLVTLVWLAAIAGLVGSAVPRTGPGATADTSDPAPPVD
jgi:undecaprenyl-diphosphatase